MAAAASPKPAPTAEPVSHAEWLAAHAARVSVIDRDYAIEIQRLEAATTKANSVRSKATSEAEAEHKAEGLGRHAAVVSEIVEAFKAHIKPGVPRTFEQVGTLGELFGNCSAKKQRITLLPLTNEFTIAMCERFAESHPDTDAIARFANGESWSRWHDNLTIFTNAVTNAFKNPYDLKPQLDAVLALESAIARTATSPSYHGVSTEEAESLWSIIRGCWPGDVEEAKRLAHATNVKRAAVAQHVEEQGLRISAVLGDATAREKLRARGAGVLEDVLKGARTMLAFAGYSDEQLSNLPLTAAGGIK